MIYRFSSCRARSDRTEAPGRFDRAGRCVNGRGAAASQHGCEEIYQVAQMGVGRRRAQAVAFIVVDMQGRWTAGLGQAGGQTAGHVRGPKRVGGAVAEEDGAA